MDEPLSNLDAKLRVQTRAELIKLHRRLGVTTIYVTHDQVEAMTMGQRIAVMKDGLLQQCDTPLELYHHPANMFVAGFLGTPAMNFLPESKVISHEGGVAVDTGEFVIHLPNEKAALLAPFVGRDVIVGIRPQDIHDKTLSPLAETQSKNTVRLKVDVLEPMGAVTTVMMNTGRRTLVAEVDAETVAREEGSMDVLIDGAAVHLFDPETEKAIV